MSHRKRSIVAGPAALALLLGIFWAAPVEATPQSSSWTGWLGCWELTQETDAGEEMSLEGRRLVCLERSDDPMVVQMTTWLDDEVVLLQEVAADGVDRQVDEGGCAGTERARFSADGQRILMSADLTCEGQPLRTSGISLMPTSSSWADIQVSEVGDQRELLVRRYRRVDAGDRIAADGGSDESLLRRTLRQTASAPIDTDDVVEALGAVDAVAVEAMLLESGDEFAVDADMLLALARADVPENVIDLMVALSYPDYFAVHEGEQEEAWDRDRYRHGRWGWGSTFYSGYYDPYFYSPFGYRYSSYYWSRPYGGTVIVGGPGPRFGGKVVNGRGYTRVSTRRDTDSSGFSLGRMFGGGGDGRSTVGGRGSDSSSRGATTRSGSSGSGRTAKPKGGSGSTGRTAKPKNGGGGGKSGANSGGGQGGS